MGYHYEKLNLPADAAARVSKEVRQIVEQDEAEQARREAEAARVLQWELDDAAELLRSHGYEVSPPRAVKEGV